MRKFSKLMLVMTITAMFFSEISFGQDSTKASMQTLFGGKSAKFKIHHLGIYFAPEVQYGQLDGAFVPLSGASAMLQINKKWGVGVMGFGGHGSRTDTTKNGGNFGGLKLEYTPKPDARVHVSFPLMLGAGEAGRGGNRSGRDGMGGRGKGGKDNDNDGGYGGMRNDGVERPSYAVIQPGIALEANVFRFARVFAGANYRFAFNSTGSSAALQGFSTNFGVKVGFFDYSTAKKPKKERKEGGERKERGRRKLLK